MKDIASFDIDKTNVFAWRDFLNDPLIVVKDRFFSPGNSDYPDTVHYVFELASSPEEKAFAEATELHDIQERIKRLSRDAFTFKSMPEKWTGYKALKNDRQREMVLSMEDFQGKRSPGPHSIAEGRDGLCSRRLGASVMTHPNKDGRFRKIKEYIDDRPEGSTSRDCAKHCDLTI